MAHLCGEKMLLVTPACLLNYVVVSLLALIFYSNPTFRIKGQEHGFLEDQHIVQSPVSPVLQTYLSPSSARSSEVGQRRQYLRSPMIPIVRSPGFRLYLSPSFARPTDTRRRVSPSIPVGSHTSVDIPASAHTSVDIPAGAHTLVGLPRKSGKRKLRSDIWEDFNAIYDEEGRLMQGQCIHCDNIFPSTKKSGSSQCRRHRLVCTEKAKLDELIGSMQPGDARIRALKKFKYDKEIACYELVRMIVLHELPFPIVEYEGSRRFVASLNPAFKLMSRTTIKQDCMAEFDRQKVELLDVLKNLPSRVSLTADLWTSNQGLDYIYHMSFCR